MSRSTARSDAGVCPPEINGEFPPPGVLPDIEQCFGIDDGKSGLLQTGGSVTGAVMSQNPMTEHHLIMCSPLSFHLQLHVLGPSLWLPGRQVQQEGHHVRWHHVLVLGDPRQLLHSQRSESPAQRSVNSSGSFSLTNLSGGLAAFLGPVADPRPGRGRRGQLLNYRSHHHRRPLREGKEDKHAVHFLFCHSSRQVGHFVLWWSRSRPLSSVWSHWSLRRVQVFFSLPLNVKQEVST